jgi:virginiamycin A acetyltransferase
MSLLKLIKDKLWKIKLNRLLFNQFESIELRQIFKKKFNITVGMYSYGCFNAEKIVKGTVIGRYCSFGPNVTILNRNHGLDFISLHPYLFNSKLGVIDVDNLEFKQCNIEDDVWIGYGAILTPSVTRVGRGAMIGAGSVVTKNVPPYAIVAGNPAKIIRYRFSQEIICKIENSEWWKLEKHEIKRLLKIDSMPLLNPSGYLEQHEEIPNFREFLKKNIAN